MTEFESGAVRETGGKGRCDLLPHSSLIRISKLMEEGCKKYPEHNWERGMPMHCMLDSAMRHIFKYMDGWTDEDHLAAAASNLLMAMWTEDKIPNMQDIPARLAISVPPEYVSEATERPFGRVCCCDGGFVGCELKEGKGEARDDES